MGMEKERDEAKEEAQVARLAAVALGDEWEKMEGDLARGFDDQSLNNWRHLWELNKKYRRQAARAWLQ